MGVCCALVCGLVRLGAWASGLWLLGLGTCGLVNSCSWGEGARFSACVDLWFLGVALQRDCRACEVPAGGLRIREPAAGARKMDFSVGK